MSLLHALIVVFTLIASSLPNAPVASPFVALVQRTLSPVQLPAHDADAASPRDATAAPSTVSTSASSADRSGGAVGHVEKQATTLETIDYGLFGTLHLTRPNGDVTQTVLFFSDRDGWSTRQDRLAGALSAEGAFVVGIDLPTYLKKLAGMSGKCLNLAGHVEEVAHWIERHEGFATYTYPLVIGDGSGATFAYALAAQAPAGTFAALITLRLDFSFRLPKELCAGDAGAMTAADGNAARVVPVQHLPLTWIARPFAPAARATGALPSIRVGVEALAAMLPRFVTRGPTKTSPAHSCAGAAARKWRVPRCRTTSPICH